MSISPYLLAGFGLLSVFLLVHCDEQDSSTSEGGEAVVCPTESPTPGDACSIPLGSFCDHGFGSPCQQYVCDWNGSTGVWTVLGDAECATCPATAPTPGTACTISQGPSCGVECRYGSTSCTCTDAYSASDPKEPTWDCMTVEEGCPEEGVVWGGGCEHEGQTCTYGVCMPDCGIDSILEYECVNGVWTSDTGQHVDCTGY